jgi:uncharacterized membrane protein
LPKNALNNSPQPGAGHQGRSLLKGVLIAALITGYALISHFALILPEGRTIAAALAVGVPAAALVWFITHWVFKFLSKPSVLWGQNALRFTLAMALALVTVLAPLWWAWPLVLANADTLYFAQHLGTNALLAWVFGHTLVAGSTPLVVTFARMVHRELPPEIAAYARHVTVAWTGFFLVTCALSIILYTLAPLAVWSAFGVLLQWPSVIVFFVGEYLLRRMLFKDFDHASMQQGFAAYQNHQASPSTVAAPTLKP